MVLDLFALAVTIFILYTGQMPFEKATTSDSHYKMFFKHKESLFWQCQESYRGEKFSAEFKDLMNSMLSFQPYRRLSLADIVAHPFILDGGQEGIATQEELYREMSQRSRQSIMHNKIMKKQD